MATDASGYSAPKSPSAKRKKSLFEEEDIIVKPSTELIPDEYEHFENESVLFHIFRTATALEENFAEDLLQCVKDINFNVDLEKNIHDLNTSAEFLANLETIKKDCANKSALILVFLGFFGDFDGSLLLLEEDEKCRNIHVKEIWNYFISNNCPELKNKPKIFIFCTSREPPRSVQIDSMRHRTMNFDKVYDFPSESDLLIVYKKIDDPFSSAKETFVNQLCSNITDYSKKYDIIDLISYINTQNSKTFPLVISTLTRKFYLTPNNERDHYLSAVENNFYLEEILKKLHTDIQRLHETQKKKKDKIFSFSFKKKSEDKPKIVKKSTKAVTDHPKASVSSINPASPSVKRSSATTVPGRRSRNMSETESNSLKKDRWRY